MIHPLLQGADEPSLVNIVLAGDLSPPAKGRLQIACDAVPVLRFIPSFEGQTLLLRALFRHRGIHPFLRRADLSFQVFLTRYSDSSLLTKGRHSVFMRLSAALNTSLCNLHKCHSCFIHIFNMPKNPPHFHFFSNYFFVFQLPSPETFRPRMI